MLTQWRLRWPGQEYRVFVQPGIECNVLCINWTLGTEGCQEVPTYEQLQIRELLPSMAYDIHLLEVDDSMDKAKERRDTWFMSNFSALFLITSFLFTLV
jgi:hypothetical protein